MSQFCAACGNTLNEGEQFCRVCGKQATASTPQVARMVGPAVTSTKAIVSLVFGIFVFFFPFSLVAIIFGHLSLSEIRKSAGRVKGDGLAISGLVLGYLGVAGVPIILIIAAIAIPNLLRARMAANESSAAASVSTIMTAEMSYASMHPDQGYTCSLSTLAESGLISTALANGPKAGYAFELSGCAPEAEGDANKKFQIVAYPVRVDQTGVRAFCADESAVIRTDRRGSAENCVQSGQPLR